MKLRAERDLLGCDAIDVAALEPRASTVQEQAGTVVDRVIILAAPVEAGERRDVADIIAAACRECGRSGVVRILRVGIFEEQPDKAVAAIKFLRDVGLDLDAVADAEGVERAVADLVKATNVEAGRFTDRSAIAEVDARFLEIDALVELDIATRFLPGVADIVDDSARSL